MERDMNLILDILELIESSNEKNLTSIEISGYEQEKIDYHFELIRAQRWIDFNHYNEHVGGGISYSIKGLTWAGHDYLDSLR